MSRRVLAALVPAALLMGAPLRTGLAERAPDPPGAERPAWLGVGYEDGRRGVRIKEVIEGTPAERAGLVVGDEIVRLDGSALTAGDDLKSRLDARKSGETVVLEVARGGRRFHLRVALATRLEPEEILQRRRLGKPAPVFDLPLASGAGAGDLERLRGKVVVVEFLATWCEACRTTYRALADLERRRSGDGLVVLGIGDESDAALRALAGLEQLPFALVRDIGGKARTDYGVTDLPTIMVIDRAGVVCYVGIGPGLPVDHALFAAERALGSRP